MNDTGTFKVTKSGGVDVTWRGHTRHYASGALCERNYPENDIPHWPLHIGRKGWASDVGAIIAAQRAVIEAHPKRFEWLRPDWETEVRGILASEREFFDIVTAVERLISDDDDAGLSSFGDHATALGIARAIRAERRQRKERAGGRQSAVSP